MDSLQQIIKECFEKKKVFGEEMYVCGNNRFVKLTAEFDITSLYDMYATLDELGVSPWICYLDKDGPFYFSGHPDAERPLIAVDLEDLKKQIFKNLHPLGQIIFKKDLSK